MTVVKVGKNRKNNIISFRALNIQLEALDSILCREDYKKQFLSEFLRKGLTLAIEEYEGEGIASIIAVLKENKGVEPPSL